jgi:threonine dehydrogenase-like Zn-dependent dehydrogenase
MKAVCWRGTQDVRVQDVPEPTIVNDRDAIVRITSTTICGSDLHLYGGFLPTMHTGDILGHECMGIVEQVGPGVGNLKPGDRVVVPFTIACGRCFFCERELWSCCDNSNPNAWMAEKVFGASPSGLLGYTHLFGGFAGGQAQKIRVPFADVGPLKIDDDSLPDEKVLFLSDILPTGWMAAENCQVRPGDTVAVWGAGPVGLLAMACLRLLGAERIIAIDDVPERLRLAETHCGAEVIDDKRHDVLEALAEMTAGRGPDSCLDAVGMEAHGPGLISDLYDRTKQNLKLETDRPAVLRQAIMAARKGGTVSLAGVYGGWDDKVPMGAAFNKGLTLKMGQTHVMRYMKPLLARIAAGEIDPSFIITHRLPIEQASEAYRIFQRKTDGAVKILLTP